VLPTFVPPAGLPLDLEVPMHRTRQRTRRAAGLSLLLLSLFAPPVAAELLLSELLSGPAMDWDGDGAVDSKLDEWVEIVNTGPFPESLENLFLRDGTGTAYHFGFSGQLLPNEVVLVTGADAVAWQAANDAGSSGLSLNNGGDTITLLRNDGSEVVVDEVVVPSHAADPDRSLARAPEGDWLLYDQINPYGGSADPAGTGCAPSPGVVNTCRTSVPVRAATFGAVKSRH